MTTLSFRKLFVVGLAGLALFAAGCSEDSTSPAEKDIPAACDDRTAVEDLGVPGHIYTWAGTGEGGWLRQNNPRLQARFSQPCDITFAGDGTAYIVDWNNHMIRSVDAAGIINTVVGAIPPFPGDGPKPHYPELNDVIEPVDGLSCWLNHPSEIQAWPDGRLLITAWHNHKLRVFDPSTGTEHVLMGRGPGFAGDARVGLSWDAVADPELDHYRIYKSGQSGGPYVNEIARVELPTFTDAAVALGKTYYYVVSAVSGSGSTAEESPLSDEVAVSAEPGASGVITRVASKAPSTPTGLSADGGGPLPYHDARVRLKQNSQAELAADGHLYILDQANQRVRRLRNFTTDPDAVIETVAGTGVAGYNGDGLDPLQTQLNFDSSTNPQLTGAMFVADDGIIYVADTKNNLVRAIDLEARTVTNLAGVPGVPGFAGDGGPANQAQVHWPMDLEIGPDGRLYFCDEYNHAVRAIDLDSGKITTIAGTLGETSGAECFVPPSEAIGDGGPATEALLFNPRGIAFGPDGRLYIVDSFHHRIRVMTLEDAS